MHKENQLYKKHKIISSLPYSPIQMNSPLAGVIKNINSQENIKINLTYREVHESKIDK